MSFHIIRNTSTQVLNIQETNNEPENKRTFHMKILKNTMEM